MALHNAVVVESHGEIETAKAFARYDLAEAFAQGVEVGVRAANADAEIRSFLLDGRGSLAVSNKGLVAARVAGWERIPEDQESDPVNSGKKLIDLLEDAWGIIANAGGGNWGLESAEWQEAAARFRAHYHATLVTHSTDPQDRPVPAPSRERRLP